MSATLARTLAGQALTARMQRNCPQTPLLILLPTTDGGGTLPTGGQTLSFDGMPDAAFAERIAEAVSGKNLSTRPA